LQIANLLDYNLKIKVNNGTSANSIATQCYEHGLPLAQIMKITGQKKLSTLQKYIKSDSDIEMMLEVGNSIGKTIK
jgi:hypothetical protein